MVAMKEIEKRRLEKYSYYLLCSWVVGWIIYYLLLSGFGYINPQIAAMKAAQLIALPFLAWIILSVYYLLRWSYHKLHRQQATAAQPAQR